MTLFNNRLSAIVVAGALSFFAASCGDSSDNVKTDADTTKMGTQSSSDVAQDMNQQNMNSQQMSDADFVIKAVAANMAEMNALKSGMAKSGNAEIKSHASMMLKDHQKMDTDMKAYAQKKGITLPTDADNADKQKLADLEKQTGADYDKGWAKMMVDDHEKVVDMFEDENGKATDAELNSMVNATLPTLRSHLDMSKQLNEKINK